MTMTRDFRQFSTQIPLFRIYRQSVFYDIYNVQLIIMINCFPCDVIFSAYSVHIRCISNTDNTFDSKFRLN